MISPLERTIIEKFFPLCSIITKIRLYAKRIDSTGVIEYYYTVTFLDASTKTILNSWFDPVLQNDDIVISCDGKYIFSPNYEKGVAQISIETGQIEYVYQAKHAFCILTTASSLICLHREYRRRLVRYSLTSHQEIESITATGVNIVQLSENCALCKRNDSQYMLVNMNNFSEHILLRPLDLCGVESDCFQIVGIKYADSGLKAKCYISNPDVVGQVLLVERELTLLPAMKEFIERHG